MIRLLFFLVLVFAAAVGFVWLADRPGELVIVWQGYEIRTSVMVAIVAVIAGLVVLAMAGALLRSLLSAPARIGQGMRARRRDRGYKALTRGMIAIGAGDNRAARRAANESRALLGDNPMVMLLSAQTAQASGDKAGAKQTFEELSAKAETRILGLHGLFVEAQRQGEYAAALHYAEEAHHVSAQIPWASQALFDYRSRAGDWAGALEALKGNEAAGLVDKHKAARLRAVLLTARAGDLEDGSPDNAREAALEANRLAPDLTPAAVLAARLLTRAGDVRKATRILESAWKIEPHPDIAATYADVRPGDAARDRLKRVQKLAGLRANHPEGAIAVAQAAIDAKDWDLARESLSGAVASGPSERICLLMADIEEGENGDIGRVRAWLARALYAPRDPVWTVDGEIFDAWAAVSPISGKVDAFEWKVVPIPLPPRPAIDLDGDPEPVEPEALPSLVGQAAEDAASALEAIEHPTIDAEEPVERAQLAASEGDTGAADVTADLDDRKGEAGDAGKMPSEGSGKEAPVPRPPDDPGPEPQPDEQSARYKSI